MPNFVSSDDDAWEPASVLDDGDTVDLLQAFVNDACTSNVREPCPFT